MKRDFELIKTILLHLEGDNDPFNPKTNVIGTENETEYYYHIKILFEAGLIEAKNLSNDLDTKWFPISLTWKGHEFLDAAKNENVWSKVKKEFLKEGQSIPFTILSELLIAFFKNELNI